MCSKIILLTENPIFHLFQIFLNLVSSVIVNMLWPPNWHAVHLIHLGYDIVLCVILPTSPYHYCSCNCLTYIYIIPVIIFSPLNMYSYWQWRPNSLLKSHNPTCEPHPTDHRWIPLNQHHSRNLSSLCIPNALQEPWIASWQLLLRLCKRFWGVMESPL